MLAELAALVKLLLYIIKENRVAQVLKKDILNVPIVDSLTLLVDYSQE